MNLQRTFIVFGVFAVLAAGSAAFAQPPRALDQRWTFDFGLGVEHTFSGNVNSGSIGTLNNQAVVVIPNSYGEVYGTGFQFHVGAGYLIDEITEIRGVFTYQSIQADLTTMGDIGVSKLYAQFSPYRSLTLDAALRRYLDVGAAGGIRPYVEALAGIGFIADIDAELSAPAANMNRVKTAFYHSTTAFALGGNAGVLFPLMSRVDAYGQLGLRWTSGLSTNDVGGLEGVTDGTSRWTVPLVVGVRARF